MIQKMFGFILQKKMRGLNNRSLKSFITRVLVKSLDWTDPTHRHILEQWFQTTNLIRIHNTSLSKYINYIIKKT